MYPGLDNADQRQTQQTCVPFTHGFNIVVGSAAPRTACRCRPTCARSRDRRFVRIMMYLGGALAAPVSRHPLNVSLRRNVRRNRAHAAPVIIH